MKNTRFLTLLLGLLFALGWSYKVYALAFNLPTNGDNVVGHLQWTQALPGDTFSSIGRRYDIGYYELVEANPGINPDNPSPGTIIVVPTRFILPPVPRQGLVVNLTELRIYFYPADSKKVITYPIGIGREGWDTPVGLMQIIEKTVNPTWYVPDSIRKAREADGVILPKFIPPGPENPLGGYRMRLSKPTYLIHGTNDYRGVGRRSSSGCMRMFPEDVEDLFAKVKVKTPVNVIDMAYKAGWENNQLYLEAHVPLQEQMGTPAADNGAMEKIVSVEAAREPSVQIDWDLAKHIVKVQSGIPQCIAKNFTSIQSTDVQQNQVNADVVTDKLGDLTTKNKENLPLISSSTA